MFASLRIPTHPRRPGPSAARVADLYRRCGALVLRRCRLLLRDPAEAEDALHEVFERLLKYGSSLENKEVPLAWFYRTADRCCFDRMRRRRRETTEDEAGPDARPAPLDESLGSEAREILAGFLQRLPEKLRRLALLHYLDGLPQERIADELGWSRRTVGKKLRQLAERAERLRRESRR